MTFLNSILFMIALNNLMKLIFTHLKLQNLILYYYLTEWKIQRHSPNALLKCWDSCFEGENINIPKKIIIQSIWNQKDSCMVAPKSLKVWKLPLEQKLWKKIFHVNQHKKYYKLYFDKFTLRPLRSRSWSISILATLPVLGIIYQSCSTSSPPSSDTL